MFYRPAQPHSWKIPLSTDLRTALVSSGLTSGQILFTDLCKWIKWSNPLSNHYGFKMSTLHVNEAVRIDNNEKWNCQLSLDSNVEKCVWSFEALQHSINESESFRNIPRRKAIVFFWFVLCGSFIVLLVNHGPSQQSPKEDHKPWKWGATARYYTAHTKTMLPTKKSVPRSSRQLDHTKTWPS